MKLFFLLTMAIQSFCMAMLAAAAKQTAFVCIQSAICIIWMWGICDYLDDARERKGK